MVVSPAKADDSPILDIGVDPTRILTIQRTSGSDGFHRACVPPYLDFDTVRFVSRTSKAE
jgi:hypothetical protein